MAILRLITKNVLFYHSKDEHTCLKLLFYCRKIKNQKHVAI